MADTDPTTQPPEDLIAQAQRIAEIIQGRQQAYAPPPPVDRSITSLLGEAVGGGTTGLSSAEREDAGRRALLNFGANLSAASGYSTMPRSFGQVFAQGVGGAQQSLAGSEAVGAARLGAQQAYEEKQQELRLAALKEAIPLLQIEQTERVRRGLLGGATPPPGTSIAAAGSYEGDIGTLEGTGKSATSTAAGVGQFIEPTWGAFVAANPDLFKGMTPEQILAARDKPEIANKAITWLAQQNAPVLAKAGVAPSGPSLALAHRLGPAAAAAVMQASDNAPVADVLVASIGKDQAAAYIKANPDLGTAKAGDLKKKYAGVHAPDFLAPPAASGAPKEPAAAPTATAPPAATLAPVQVAGPGAPTGTTSMATDAPPAPEELPLADAMAKAKATGQPVMFQGGNGAAVKPDGTINMPAAASATPAQPPAPARVPDTFTPRPVPLPPEVQQRIDHPETPEITQAYRTQIGSASGPDAGKQMQEAQTARAAAVAKVKAEAIAQAQTIRERGEAQQIEEWKVRRAEQRAIDAAEATRAAELEKLHATADETRKTADAALEGGYVTKQREKLDTIREASRSNINDLQMLGALSDAAGAATPIQNITVPGGKTVRDWLVGLGIGTDAQIQKMGAQQAFKAAVNKTITGLRSGMNMGQLSDRDMQFITEMAPDMLQSPETRKNIIAYLEHAQYRSLDFADKLEQIYDAGKPKGMTWAQARREAEKQMPEYIERIPAAYNTMSADEQKSWKQTNLRPGQLIRSPEGLLTRYDPGRSK